MIKGIFRDANRNQTKKNLNVNKVLEFLREKEKFNSPDTNKQPKKYDKDGNSVYSTDENLENSNTKKNNLDEEMQ